MMSPEKHQLNIRFQPKFDHETRQKQEHHETSSIKYSIGKVNQDSTVNDEPRKTSTEHLLSTKVRSRDTTEMRHHETSSTEYPIGLVNQDNTVSDQPRKTSTEHLTATRVQDETKGYHQAALSTIYPMTTENQGFIVTNHKTSLAMSHVYSNGKHDRDVTQMVHPQVSTDATDTMSDSEYASRLSEYIIF